MPLGTGQRIARLREHGPWLLAVFALAVLLRSLWVAYLNLDAGNDGWLFWIAANSLANGEGFRSEGRSRRIETP